MSACREIAEIIANEAEACVQYLNVDHRTFLWRARRVVEALLLWMHADAGVLIQTNTTERTIDKLSKHDKIASRIQSVRFVDAVTQYCNDGVHIRLTADEQNLNGTVDACVPALKELLKRFVADLAARNASPENFPPECVDRLKKITLHLEKRQPTGPESPIELAKRLRIELDAARRKLGEVSEAMAALDGELENTREQRESLKKDLERQRLAADRQAEAIAALRERDSTDGAGVARELEETRSERDRVVSDLRRRLSRANLGGVLAVLAASGITWLAAGLASRRADPACAGVRASERSTAAAAASGRVDAPTPTPTAPATTGARGDGADAGLAATAPSALAEPQRCPDTMDRFPGGLVHREIRRTLSVDTSLAPFCMERRAITVGDILRTASALPEIVAGCDLTRTAPDRAARCTYSAAEAHCHGLHAALPSTAHWVHAAEQSHALDIQSVRDEDTILEWTATPLVPSGATGLRNWTRKADMSAAPARVFLLNDFAALGTAPRYRAIFRCVIPLASLPSP